MPAAPPAAAQENAGPNVTVDEDQTRCLETGQITGYKTENDKTVRFFMENGEDMLLKLKRLCPQLHFHRYISYTPVDGKLCAGSDKIKTRAGVNCRIFSISPALQPPVAAPQAPPTKPRKEAKPANKPAANPQ